MYSIIDVTALAFYGIVCTLLAAFTPQTPRLWKRGLIGGVVGIAAALLLPMLRQATGL